MAAADLPRDANPLRRLGPAGTRWLIPLAVLAATPTYLAFGARLWWVLELATHFRVCYLLLLTPLGLALLCYRRWKTLAWVAIAWSINVFLVMSLYLGAQPQAASHSLRVLSANVLSTNPQHDRVLKLIRSESPDVVVLLEVDDAWRKSLEVLDASYPYSLVKPRVGSFGIALFSKLPADELELTEIGQTGIPSLRAVLRLAETSISLIATHTPPPTGPEGAHRRNRQLAALAETMAGETNPRLLVGDLNITPWSPYFRDLLKQGRLHNSQQGFGVQPTWLAGLSIDHLLHSEDIAIQLRRVGPPIGSDHRPLIVDLGLHPAGNR